MWPVLPDQEAGCWPSVASGALVDVVLCVAGKGGPAPQPLSSNPPDEDRDTLSTRSEGSAARWGWQVRQMGEMPPAQQGRGVSGLPQVLPHLSCAPRQQRAAGKAPALFESLKPPHGAYGGCLGMYLPQCPLPFELGSLWTRVWRQNTDPKPLAVVTPAPRLGLDSRG